MTTSNSTPTTNSAKAVVILGASNNTRRYAWLAQQSLLEHGYPVLPVSINYPQVGGIPAYSSVAEIPGEIDTITVYLNPENLSGYVDQILAAKPRRVIFNPGSESPDAVRRLSDAGIEVELACTLVLLRTGQF